VETSYNGGRHCQLISERDDPMERNLPSNVAPEDVEYYSMSHEVALHPDRRVRMERGKYVHGKATAVVDAGAWRFGETIDRYQTIEGVSDSLEDLCQLHDLILASAIRPIVSWDNPQITSPK